MAARPAAWPAPIRATGEGGGGVGHPARPCHRGHQEGEVSADRRTVPTGGEHAARQDALAAGGQNGRVTLAVLAGGALLMVLLAAVWLQEPGWLGAALRDTPDRVRPAGEPAGGAGQWRDVPEAPIRAREHAHGVDLGDGRVLVVGGLAHLDPAEVDDGEPAGDVAQRDGAIVDATEGSWTPVPAAPDPPVDEPVLAGRIDEGSAPGLLPLPQQEDVQGDEAMVFYRHGEVPPLGRQPDPVVRWTDETLLVWRSG